MQKHLSPTAQKFILHWGEMGLKWGINRSVAQVHALLFLAEEPVNAETIAEQLALARSNVSTSLKELQAWGLIRTVHLLGDRRDHFQVIGDIWDMFRKIAEQRKHRELDPTRDFVRDCLAELKAEKPHDPHLEKTFTDLLDFMDTVFSFYDQLNSLSTSSLKKFARLGKKIHRLLGMT